MIDAIRLGSPAQRQGAPALATVPPLSHRLLRLVWEEQPISRAEIARRATLSRSTVSDGVAPLLASGLVVESGIGESRGGRRPIVLTFQDDAHVLIGIDVAIDGVRVVATDLRGRVLGRRQVTHPVGTDPEGTLKRIAENAGANGAVVAEHVRNKPFNEGYNAATGEYVDMLAAGIVDPAKVTRSGLQNAASIAGMVLTTECIVADLPEKKDAAPAGGGMGGGDFDY